MSLLNHRLIITVNRRLTRELTRQYTVSQVEKGNEVWESPTILPWASWLNSLWRQELDQKRDQPILLLNSMQSRVIWEGIIRYSSAANGLLQVSETTRVAMEAWKLLHDYNLKFDSIKPRLMEHNLDSQAFCEWASAYQARLTYKRWFDQDMLANKLIEHFAADWLVIPDQVLLAGFDELNPLQQHFLNVLTDKGCRIETYASENLRENAVRIACVDTDNEMQLVASRVRYLLEQNSALKIGVVVADLHKRKSQIVKVFENKLLPGTVLPGSKLCPPFNFSLGEPLSSFPLIRTAFLILASVTGRLPLEDLSRLIRSPFIAAGDTEMAQRCLLDARLREYGDDSLGIALVIREATAEEHWRCSILSERLYATRQLIEETEINTKKTIVEWIKLFDAVLDSMGWPGERLLNSEEYQTFESWRSLREQLVTLETVTQKMGYSVALNHLRKIASDQTFQPETPDVPVQIMGMLEVTGLQFDHLLVLGMTDDQWPAKPTSNPFLPLGIQRETKMPHATAEWELLFARSMTDRLLDSAADIIFSYPTQEADRKLRPSPLIKSLPEISIDTIEISAIGDIRQQMQSQVRLEEISDYQTRALPENNLWRGGVSLFKDQAACPFRAFVRHRLRAEPLGVAESGLNPAERGSLVHAALENIWCRLKSQENLNKLSDVQIKKAVQDSVEQALQEFHSGKSIVQLDPFRKLELSRLDQLLTEWLEIERDRDPFIVVAREQEMTMSVAGINLKTRIDRIDQLVSGELILIDYKTGDVNIKSWEGVRPDEPQLPLYATSMEETPQAVLFAKLKKGEQAYKGLSADLDIGPGVSKKNHEQWQQLVTDWRDTLQDLASQFIRGEAPVDPKDNKTCLYCSYQSLCRIDELVGLSGEPTAQEDE